MTQQPDFVYAPDSTIWRINRERVLWLAGGRVLLMQLAHPMVAEAVYKHSYVFDKPILRLQRTLTLTLTTVFGTREEVQRSVEEIEAAHRPAVGRLDESVGKHAAGASYNPRNPRQALWVFATLIEGALTAYHHLVTPIDDATRSAFYQESLLFANMMGISAGYLPDNYDALLDYMQSAIETQEVHVGEKARQVAPFVIGQTIPIVNWLTLPASRFNIGLLPEAIQAQYGYRTGAGEQKLLDAACRVSRAILPTLPDKLRYVPQYRRALKLLNAAQ